MAAQGIDVAHSFVIPGTDRAAVRAELATVLEASSGADLPPLAVLDANLIVNAPPLGAVLDDPRVDTGALSAPEGQHQVFLGVLKIDGSDRPLAAGLLRNGSADTQELVDDDDPLLALTQELVAAGVLVRPVPIGGYAWARPATSDAAGSALAQIAAVDERTVRLREAARGGDGFYSTFVLRRLSWRLTSIAERLGLTPNQVTLISFALGLIGAAALAVGDRGWSVIGALLLQVCLVVDCVDGELARYRRRFSRFGAWLDATTDRIKEFAAIAALAVAGRRPGHDLWFLAAAAIALQTFRNLLDLGWSQQRRAITPAPTTAPAAAPVWVRSEPELRLPAAGSAGPGALSWARRVGHFPIGERFLLISLGAALWTPRGTLIALLVAGVVSAVYMLGAFALRSRSAATDADPVLRLADVGPLLGAALRSAAGERAGRLIAVVPAAVAVAELGLTWWLAVGVGGARPGAVLVLVAVVAIAHYQQAYGVREDSVDAGGPVIGTDLRLLALVVLVVVPGAFASDTGGWSTAVVWVLAVLIALSSTARSLRGWIGHGDARSGPPGPEPSGPETSAVLREAIGGLR